MKGARLIVAVVLAAGTLSESRADTPYPVIGEPVLRPDSQFEKTDWGYKRKDLSFPAGRWPTVYTMEGYDGASRSGDPPAPPPGPNVYLRMDDGELIALRITFGAGPRKDYAFVQASIRGTECSGGNFNLYDRRHALDGFQIVEWIAAQPWSNERVGMFGSSYPGQTAYWVASTRPPHLAAVSANLLHSDIYRDIFMPGGVQNILFPAVWTYGTGVVAGPHRVPNGSVEEGTIPGDEICTQAQASRYSAGDLFQPQLEPVWRGIEGTDNAWYASHAAITYAPMITIPFYLQNNWQDEQVGPRSVVLWHHIHPTPRTIVNSAGETVTVVPKKFVLSSGDHGYGGFAGRDRWPWFDIWLLDMPDSTGLLDDAVVNHFETREVSSQPTTWAGTKSGPSWPLPDTEWTRIYLRENGALGWTAPPAAESTDAYLSGVARQIWFFYAPGAASDLTTARKLPDVLGYESPALGAETVIAGPIIADLYASIAGTDADFFVSISDVWPDRRVSYLQRGLLKASHRAIDLRHSYCVGSDGLRAPCEAPGSLMVQPYRPHTNPQPVMPGEINLFRIEIFPLGHVFRQGHRILVQIHTPPAVDGLWGYTPTHHQPAAVTVYHDPDHPSSIQLPIVTPDAPIANATGCQVPGGFPCTPPSALDAALGD